MMTLVPLLSSVKPPGTLANARLKGAAAGPLLWMTAWKAVGTWAPLNGTVNIGSGCTARVMPGTVGVMVTLTVVCATNSGLVVDWAMTWIGYVPPWRPGAG